MVHGEGLGVSDRQMGCTRQWLPRFCLYRTCQMLAHMLFYHHYLFERGGRFPAGDALLQP